MLYAPQLSEDGSQITTQRSSPPDTTRVPSSDTATAVTAPVSIGMAIKQLFSSD